MIKKILKGLGLTIGVIFIALLTIPFLLKDKIIDIVKQTANDMLNAKVEFADLDISLIRHFPQASISLEDLEIIGKDKFENDTLVSTNSIDIVVNLMSLFSDNGYEINHIIFDTPNINAIVLSDGKANWDIMKNDSTEVIEETEPEVVIEDEADTTSSPFKLQLKEFSIDNASVFYTDSSSNMAFAIENLNLTLSGNMNDMRTDLKLKTTIEKLSAAIDGISYIKNASFSADINVDADLENNKYTLKENVIALNAIELGIDGWVALPDDEIIEMDLSLNSSAIKFKDILSMIPAIYQNSFDDLTATGDLNLSANVKGILNGDYLPDFNATLNVNNGQMSYEGLPKSIDKIILTANVTHPQGIADLTKVAASLGFSIANNPFNISANIANPISDLSFNAAAKGILNLGMVKEVYPLGDSIDINGTFNADLNFKGKLSDIEKERYEKIVGEGYLTISDMVYKQPELPEVLVNKLAMVVSTKALTLKDMDINLGKSDISANGTISNYIAYLLKDETLKGSLNVTSTLLDLNEIMGSETSSTENNSKDDTNTTSTETQTETITESVNEAFEIPKNLDLTLKSSFNKVLFQKIVIDNLKGTITVKDGTAKMNSLKFNAFGGSVAAGGSFSTAKDKTKPTISFNLDLAKALFERTFDELDMIKQLVPIFAKTGGNYSADIKIEAELDSDFNPNLNTLEAVGTIKSNEITVSNVEAFNLVANSLKTDALRDVKAVNIKIPFKINNGRVITNPFDLKIKDTNINLSGSTGLDQTIDYDITITLPEGGKVSEYVGKIPGTITGSFSKPIVKLDFASIAKDAVKNTISTQLEKATGKDMSEQIAQIREEADKAANKLVEIAKSEGQKLVDKASNPLAKIAAQATAKKLEEEAKKQADALRAKAEEEITKLENKL